MDKKRVRGAYFEPLSQDPNAAPSVDEQCEAAPTSGTIGGKDLDVNVEPVEVTDAAGPARRG